ncbi:MAG TPA: hypothetical protein DCG69_02720 [Bacteroidales bacterium]|nr:hypothetical protein [Bacteroidales bacterium]
MEGFEKKMELRIILNESDSYHGNSLCRLIVEKAHEIGIPGATVLQTKGGYGSRNKIHTSDVLRLSNDLPVVITLADDLGKLNELISFVKARYKGGLISLQEIWISKK